MMMPQSARRCSHLRHRRSTKQGFHLKHTLLSPIAKATQLPLRSLPHHCFPSIHQPTSKHPPHCCAKGATSPPPVCPLRTLGCCQARVSHANVGLTTSPRDPAILGASGAPKAATSRLGEGARKPVASHCGLAQATGAVQIRAMSTRTRTRCYRRCHRCWP